MVSNGKLKPTPENAPKSCTRCQGRGWIDNRCAKPDKSNLCTFCNGKGFSESGKECYACHGTGLIETRMEDKNPCPLCNGAGVFPVPVSMTYGEFAYHPGLR